MLQTILSLFRAARTDPIQHAMGSFGKYQLGLCFIVSLSKIFVGFHQMAILLLAPRTNYTCPGPGKMTCPCENPKYDKSVFTKSIIVKWDLICDKRWMVSFTQLLFQLGTLIGSIIFGMASDRFGRKNPLIFAVVLQVTMAVIAAFVPDYWSFTIFRFIVGISVGGAKVIGIVIIMEFVGSQYRDVMSALYQLPFNIGHMLLPIFGFFFRDYKYFQLGISGPGLILLLYFCLVPESPRWLIAIKRTDEAVSILTRVAQVNDLPTENIRSNMTTYQASIERNQLKNGCMIDLLRTPNLRKNIMAMALNWLACNYCFYGVSQYVGQLSGNLFINITCNAGLTCLGTLSSIPIMRVLGRRTILIIFNFICGAVFLVLAVMPDGYGRVVCACIGVVCSFICYVLIHLYCGEMFPTVVRNSALGFSMMWGRVGALVAPLVLDLSSAAPWLPSLVFAIVPLLAGLSTFLLPETKGRPLMTTIEEGERFGKNKLPAVREK